MIGWAVCGPASAGRWGGWATSGYLLGLIYVVIGSFVAKRYEKKTGKSIQELAEEQEKENKLVEKAKKDSNTKDDDFDDGLQWLPSEYINNSVVLWVLWKYMRSTPL